MWSTFAVLAVTLAGAYAFSAGAPEEACSDITPHHHGLRAKKSAAPYTISTNTEVAKGGSPLEVVIKGKSPKDLFRGVLLQARQGDKIVGTFSIPSNHNNFLQLLDCGEPGNAVTHKSHRDAEDRQSATVTWTPPAGFNGAVKFRATIVRNFENFWVGVESSPLKVAS